MHKVIIKPAGFEGMTITIQTREISSKQEYDNENDAFIDIIETDSARVITINKFLTTIEPKGEFAYAVNPIKIESNEIIIEEVKDE